MNKEHREQLAYEKLAEKKWFLQKTLVKKLIIWTLILAGSAAFLFGLVKLATVLTPSQTATLTTPVSANDWQKGTANPKVILVEYSDFQCPACALYYPILKQLTNQFSDQLQFVYRHFPLPSHNNAKLAATATEAAGIQGKFWEMHDLIFENQNTWSEQKNAKEVFLEYAANLNLDIEKFKNDLDSATVKNKVANDEISGKKAGVNSTPTFFLNGTKLLNNPRNYVEFSNLINEQIKNP